MEEEEATTMEFAMDGGGRLRVWEDAGRVFFRAERKLDREGLYKVWIRGDGGEMLLGTLVPEGEHLALGRTVWPMELRQCGCWPVKGVKCVMAFRFHSSSGDGWRWEDHPERFVDRETARVGEWRRMLVYKGKDELYLACPFRNHTPIPLNTLFCLAKPKTIRGELCLLWRFDSEGKPCLPDKSGRQDFGRAR